MSTERALKSQELITRVFLEMNDSGNRDRPNRQGWWRRRLTRVWRSLFSSRSESESSLCPPERLDKDREVWELYRKRDRVSPPGSLIDLSRPGVYVTTSLHEDFSRIILLPANFSTSELDQTSTAARILSTPMSQRLLADASPKIGESTAIPYLGIRWLILVHKEHAGAPVESASVVAALLSVSKLAQRYGLTRIVVPMDLMADAGVPLTLLLQILQTLTRDIDLRIHVTPHHAVM